MPVLTVGDGLRAVRLKLIDPQSGRLLTWGGGQGAGLRAAVGDRSVPEMLLHAGQVLRHALLVAHPSPAGPLSGSHRSRAIG